VLSEERIYAEAYIEFGFTFAAELRNLIASCVWRFSVIKARSLQSYVSIWKNFILKILKTERMLSGKIRLGLIHRNLGILILKKLSNKACIVVPVND
jgi:hypothetical protein